MAPSVPKSAKDNPFKRIGIVRLLIGVAVLGYLDSNKDGDNRYQCLVAVSH